MNRIFLWGPSGSGKTWLLNSFIRKINLLRIVFKKENSPYDIWVEDESGFELEANNLMREATKKSDYQKVVYRRLVRNSELGSDLFSNNHVIGMLDGPGDETTGQIEKDANTPENRKKVSQAREALKDADYLFVVVHPGKRTWSDADGQAKNSDNAGEHFSERLRALLKLKRKPSQRVLLCFTQSDQYGGELGGLDAALANLFGPRSPVIAVQLRQLFSSTEPESPIYYLSSVGYYQDPTNNKRVPNYDESSHTLLDESKWNPYKILEPFFSVFDNVQEEYIKQNVLHPNILFRIFFNKVLLHDRLMIYKEHSNIAMLREGETKISNWIS